ncbi:hypothetical protein CC78DRAFT_536172 [Lojkania enalia]|uniref:Uncharacterized protein n=1 Tax=Lojkania enalia TaxID=147567 RepID=A0A9P4K2B0_9PLEO|nr:hypothetical protein CC78DRAFT_536172 [Didymosphaeria enalia]
MPFITITRLLIPLLLSSSISASPLPHITRRSARSRKIGTGFAIAISLIIFTVLVFFLGMRYGQTGTWRIWRAPLSLPTSTTNTTITTRTNPTSHPTKKKPKAPPQITISSPTEISPIERSTAPGFQFELPAEQQIFEIGAPSPRRVGRRGEDKNGERQQSSRWSIWGRKKSLYEMEGDTVPAISARVPPSPALSEKARMDWSGMEYVKKMYG